MKKGYGLLLVAALAMSLTGCGEKKEAANGVITISDIESDKVTLGDYKGLSVEKTVVEVTDEDVQAEVDMLKEDYTGYEEVDRGAKGNDHINMAFTANIDGKTIYSVTADEGGYELYLGDEEFGKEFDNKLQGVKAGDKLDFDISYDADYEDEELAGQTVDFAVEVLSVIEVSVPELDDAFIKDTLGYESEEDMYSQIREKLENENDATGVEDAKEALLQQVINNSSFSGYPETLYNKCKRDNEEVYMSYAEMFGCDTLDEVYEMFGMSAEDVEAENKNDTYRFMVVGAIADKEKIRITDSEFDSMKEEYAVKQEYETADEMLEDVDAETVKLWMLQDKIKNLLYENATVTEVKVSADDMEFEE